MANVLEKTLLMGLGVFTLTREKVKEAVNELVEEEGVEPEEAQKLADALVTKGEEERRKLRHELRGMIRQEVSRVKPVTQRQFEGLKQEFEALKEDVGDLAERIEQKQEESTTSE
jgi:polyhydroxyalkanoate synthesis regulator phasin